MSRTWKREPTRRNRDEYIEMDHYGAIQRRLVRRKEPIPCTIGELSQTHISGDNTFMREMVNV